MSKKFFTIVIEDADLWRQSGLTPAEEDAVILALWKWRRGRVDDSALSVPARLVYAPIVARWEYNEPISEVRSEVGKRGAEARWKKFANSKGNSKGNGKVMPKHECPTSTSTSTSPSASTSTDEVYVGDTTATPMSHRFVKPTENEVRAYCNEQGYVNVDAGAFIDYYESKGWVVGKTPMKDWKASVRTWHRNALGKSVKTEPTFKQDGYTIRLGKESK